MISRYFCKAFILSLIVCVNLFALEAPEKFVENMLSEAKRTNSLEPILNKIDWNAEYQANAENLKKTMAINSADEFRSFTSLVAKDPEKAVNNMLDRMTANMPPDQKAVMDQMKPTMIAQLKDGITKETNNWLNKWKTVNYKIGTATVEGANATVPVSFTIDNETKDENIKLKQNGDSWYLRLN